MWGLPSPKALSLGWDAHSIAYKFVVDKSSQNQMGRVAMLRHLGGCGMTQQLSTPLPELTKRRISIRRYSSPLSHKLSWYWWEFWFSWDQERRFGPRSCILLVNWKSEKGRHQKCDVGKLPFGAAISSRRNCQGTRTSSVHLAALMARIMSLYSNNFPCLMWNRSSLHLVWDGFQKVK